MPKIYSPDVSPKVVWAQRIALNRDAFVVDGYLFASSEINGVGVWDVETGARLLQDSSFAFVRYHRGTQEFLSRLPNGDFQLSKLVEQGILR